LCSGSHTQRFEIPWLSAYNCSLFLKMAFSAHKDEEMLKERFDSPNDLQEKIKRLVKLIQNSKHMVCFTGAGISTSAGIPDFRGPEGKWTREAKGLKPKSGVKIVEAYPTATHMSIVQLQSQGYLKYLISQNCDGLHRRSGFPNHVLSELHGNCNKEICEDCGQSYFRDFACYRLLSGRDHFTGRFCVRPDCEGRLLNSTIDFGQGLPQVPLQLAYENSKRSDLHIALGSSLTVSPACDMPRITGKKINASLVIINLQKTPLTDEADFQIYAKTDDVMKEVMKQLDLQIPEFCLRRKIIVGAAPQEDRKVCHYIRGADFDDPSLTMSFLKDVHWKQPTVVTSAPEKESLATSVKSKILKIDLLN